MSQINLKGKKVTFHVKSENIDSMYYYNMCKYYFYMIYENIPIRDQQTVYITIKNSSNPNKYLIKYKTTCNLKINNNNEGEFKINKPKYIYPIAIYIPYEFYETINVFKNKNIFIHYLDKKIENVNIYNI